MYCAHYLSHGYNFERLWFSENWGIPSQILDKA